MLRTILAVIALTLSLHCIAQSDKHSLRIHGSNTVGEKFAPLLIEHFYRSLDHPLITTQRGAAQVEQLLIATNIDKSSVLTTELFAHGSSTGFKALLRGEADVAMSSRPIKLQEAKGLVEQYPSIIESSTEYPIAYDALAVVVHPNNPVSQLSIEQLAQIFSGEVQSWSQLGGKDTPIKVLARDQNSGTFDTFQSLVLKKYDKQITEQAFRFESSEKLVASVAENESSIGFVGFAHVGQTKLVAISKQTNAIAVLPNRFTVGTEEYPLSRKLYMYLPNEVSNPLAREFIEYVTSNQGQALCAKVGLISFLPTTSSPKIARHLYPRKYVNLADFGKRLSVVFRLDNGGFNASHQRDIQRVNSYFAKNKYRKLVFAALGEKTSANQAQAEKWLDALAKQFDDVGSGTKQLVAFQNKTQLQKADTAAELIVEVWAL